MCLGGRIRGRCCDGNKVIKPHVTVPLIGASSKVTIIDFVAQVELKQRYENQDIFPIEATYEFPLPEGAAVTAFIIEVDGTIIHSKIKEKEKAKEIYDDAIAEGHGAYLLEENANNWFTTSVGNLPPGKEVLITIVYVQELKFNVDGVLEFVMPTTKFAPNGFGDFAAFTMSKTATFEKDVPYGVQINTDVRMGSKLKKMSSRSHPNTIVSDGYQNTHTGHARIIQIDGTPLTDHWQLQIELDMPNEPFARVQKTDESTVAMLSFYPQMKEAQIFTEIIFLVDRSGSMKLGAPINTLAYALGENTAKSKIEKVKDTLEIFMRSLPEGTMFNIVSFGTSFSKLFDKSVEYNEKNFNAALAHVQSMTANMGGTNIINPMKSIFSEPSIEGVPRQIFLLTDGEVPNRDECIDTVKKFAKTTRVFTFGIGKEADDHLIKGMATAAYGSYEIILDDDNMEEKVLRQLNRALKPAFMNMRLDWGDMTGTVEQSPLHCPPMFSGSHITFYGILPKNTTGTHVITFHAKTAAGPVQNKISINFDEPVEGEFVTKLAAKSLISDLQNDRSSMHTDAGDLIKSKYTQQQVNNKIIEISLKHQVMSKLTAFVAVEKRKEATIGTMQRIDMKEGSRVPSKKKKKNSHSKGGQSSQRRSFKSLTKQSKMRSSEFDGMSDSDEEEEEKKDEPVASKTNANTSTTSTVPVVTQVSNEVRAVIKQQAFNGSFSMQTLQSLAPKVTIDTVKKVLTSAGVEVNAKHEAAVVTLMVAVLFELKFSDQKSVWDLVVKKAVNWAKKELGGIDFAALETSAKTLLA